MPATARTRPDPAITLQDLTAAAYDAYSPAFLNQADGEPCDARFAGPGCGEVDRQLWARIDGELVALRAAGRDEVRILDAGCGPGLWLIRIARRARELGFAAVEAHGIDIAPEMIVQASRLALDMADGRTALHFSVGDIATATRGLPSAGFDLTLCLYGVLNHVARPDQSAVAAELCRLTRRALLVTVRTAGGPPSIYVQDMERARSFRQDNLADRLDVTMADGRQVALASHLFTARELRQLFAGHVRIAELLGLDIFRRRFAPRPQWHSGPVAAEPAPATLEQMERRFASDPDFIDRAAHLLLVGLPKDRSPVP